MINQIGIIIEPRKNDLGDGFIVRRLLPFAKKRMVGPFIFWDHMGPVQLGPGHEMKVRAHPHIGLSTLTYLLSGEIMHRDSLGTEQLIKPGEINWMTAGQWISHSERSKPIAPMTLEGIQVWVALPKEKEDVEPSFNHHKSKDLPFIQLGDLRAYLIAGHYEEHKSPVYTYSPLFYLNAPGKKDQTFKASIPKGHEGAVYVMKGGVNLNGQEYLEGTLICFEGGSIELELSRDSDLMFFGGQPFPEERFIFWNFVSSSKEKIERAKEKWLSGQFEPVINEIELIPLPGEKREH